MGRILSFHCEKCGYFIRGSFGIGMLFPKVYQSTINAARKGELGEELQKFLAENPNGAIDVSRILVFCPECGEYEDEPDLSMYIPKENTPPVEKYGRWSVAMPFEGEDYVTPYDLHRHYKLFAKYPRKCKNCGGNLKIVDELENLECPTCHTILTKKCVGMWD